MKISQRRVGDVLIWDLSGRITFSEGSSLLRDTIQARIRESHLRFVFNLQRVHYVDGSVRPTINYIYACVENAGGELKIINVKPNVKRVLGFSEISLNPFNPDLDEVSAIRSFGLRIRRKIS